MTTIDCVVSYHTNPFTCGVAKFNQLLANRLDVPVVPIFDERLASFARPCLSIKVEEFSTPDLERLEHAVARLAAYDLFLHALTGTEFENRLVQRAGKVFGGNAFLTEKLRELRPDAIEAWCPGTLMDFRDFADTEVSIFSFGMAHKVQVEKYQRLRELLDQTGRTYSIYLSTAFHEGTTFEGAFADTHDRLKSVFGDQLYFLGFLSDMAAYNYLKRCTYFAAFFTAGLRANNTSVNAALELGVPVITNLDSGSPPAVVQSGAVVDITRTSLLPCLPGELETMREAARTASKSVGWDRLLRRLHEIE
jgi:hypothetical protein